MQERIETDDDDDDEAPPLAERTAVYVERLVAQSLQRELEQEESFLRSLPFFATSLGALLAFIGLMRPGLPPLAAAPLTLLTYLLLALTIVTVLGTVWFLSRALGRLTEVRPLMEGDLVRYAGELTAYYAAAERRSGSSPADNDRAVVAELRALVIDEITGAAAAVRTANPGQRDARPRAFRTLLAALFFALALFAAISVQSLIDGAPGRGSSRPDPRAADQPPAQRRGRGAEEAGPAADARVPDGPVAQPRGAAGRADGAAPGPGQGGLITRALPPRLLGVDELPGPSAP